jgi:large conductance mechanosensitive channel
MKKFADEFFAFISKGNVIDLAVAVMIGASFQRIVSGLVNFVFMPIIGWLVKTDFTEWFITLQAGIAVNPMENNLINPPSGWLSVPIRISYGLLIQAMIDFFIIALILFLVVKIVKKSEQFRLKIKEEIRESILKELPKLKKQKKD